MNDDIKNNKTTISKNVSNEKYFWHRCWFMFLSLSFGLPLIEGKNVIYNYDYFYLIVLQILLFFMLKNVKNKRRYLKMVNIYLGISFPILLYLGAYGISNFTTCGDSHMKDLNADCSFYNISSTIFRYCFIMNFLISLNSFFLTFKYKKQHK